VGRHVDGGPGELHERLPARGGHLDELHGAWSPCQAW
jgi:hypothetical protein